MCSMKFSLPSRQTSLTSQRFRAPQSTSTSLPTETCPGSRNKAYSPISMIRGSFRKNVQERQLPAKSFPQCVESTPPASPATADNQYQNELLTTPRPERIAAPAAQLRVALQAECPPATPNLFPPAPNANHSAALCERRASGGESSKSPSI